MYNFQLFRGLLSIALLFVPYFAGGQDYADKGFAGQEELPKCQAVTASLKKHWLDFQNIPIKKTFKLKVSQSKEKVPAIVALSGGTMLYKVSAYASGSMGKEKALGHRQRIPDNLDDLSGIYNKASQVTDLLSNDFYQVKQHTCFSDKEQYSSDCSNSLHEIYHFYGDLSERFSDTFQSAKKLITIRKVQKSQRAPDSLEEYDENFLSDAEAQYETAVAEWQQAQKEAASSLNKHDRMLQSVVSHCGHGHLFRKETVL